VGRADDSIKKRKPAAQQMSKDLARLALHKVYVPDFVDTSGKRTALGCFFGASFSKLIGENAKNFAIISRIDVNRYLDKNGWSDSDLSNADVMSKLASEFSLDGILSGMISSDHGTYTIDFTVRDVSGRELFRTQYREKIDPVVSANLPVENEVAGHNFYFAGLDGVTNPKCVRCPIPPYPDELRASRVQGSIMLSVLITAEGKTDHIYLLKKLSPDFDRDAIDKVKSWRFEPSKDPSGSNVAVRVPIEVTYTQY
jgi:TonB family protein